MAEQVSGRRADRFVELDPPDAQLEGDTDEQVLTSGHPERKDVKELTVRVRER